MSSLMEYGDALSAWANVGLFVLTAAVSAFGIYQFVFTTKFNHAQSAKSIYANYLRMAFDYPHYANPALSEIDYDAQTLNGSRVEFEKYEWFVASVVMACEEIFHLSDNPACRSSIMADLRFHRAYFCCDHFRSQSYLQNVDAEVGEIIETIVSRDCQYLTKGNAPPA